MKFLDSINQLVAFIALIWSVVGLVFGWLTFGEFTIFLVLSYLVAIQKPVILSPKA